MLTHIHRYEGNCLMRINAVTRLGGLAAIAVWACLSLGAASPANAAVTYQQVVNWHSGKCLDVAGGSQAVGARVQQYTCNGTPAQQWTQEFTGSGYFRLRVGVSGQCLTVKDASQDDNAPVVQQPCTWAYNQQWIQQTSGVIGWPFLIARHSGDGLTIQSESLLNGARAVQYTLDFDGPDTLHAGDWQFQ